MLIRFDPFRDFDRLSQQMWGNLNATQAELATRIPFDAVRKGDRVELSFELPGVDADSINVEVEKNMLTVTAERNVETERREGDEVIVRERRHGTFTRQLTLGENLDSDKLEARYDDGVLHLSVPVAPQAQARRVEVTKGAGQRAIDTTADQQG